jgi:hypothetical protein
MAIIFDPSEFRIILSTSTVTATEIYSAWVDWAAASDNAKYGLVVRQVGSDDLGSGLSIPPYYFLQGNWRIRPMELSHTLTISGNLFVDGGADPVVPTLGNFNVLVKTVVPVQAQTVNVGGGVGTVDQVRDAVWSAPISNMTDGTTIGGWFKSNLLTVSKFLGLK